MVTNSEIETGDLDTKENGIFPNLVLDVKQLLGLEIQTLEQISVGIEADIENNIEDIEHLIKKHHGFLRESIAVLTKREAPENEKSAHLARFFHLLNMHAAAEEETLYPALRQCDDKDARIEGMLAQDEHNLAFQLASEIQEMGSDWTEEIEAKVHVLATLVSHHIEEEENHLLDFAQEKIEWSRLKSVATEYLLKCRSYLAGEMRADEDGFVFDQEAEDITAKERPEISQSIPDSDDPLEMIHH